MQESIRLWPTTPTLLRERLKRPSGAKRPTVHLDAGASVLICVPAFHRDADALPFADVFTPDIWLDGRADTYPQLVPFTAGPAQCPGQNVALFATSTFLAQVLSRLELDLRSSPKLTPDEPLPVTLNHFGLRFGARPVSARSRAG
jgi:cytochrome P450